jgi:hypothetical protein
MKYVKLILFAHVDFEKELWPTTTNIIKSLSFNSYINLLLQFRYPGHKTLSGDKRKKMLFQCLE